MIIIYYTIFWTQLQEKCEIFSTYAEKSDGAVHAIQLPGVVLVKIHI